MPAAYAPQAAQQKIKQDVFFNRIFNVRKEIILPAYHKVVEAFEKSGQKIIAVVHRQAVPSNSESPETLAVNINGDQILMDVNCDMERKVVTLRAFNQTRNLSLKTEQSLHRFSINTIEKEITRFFNNHIW